MSDKFLENVAALKASSLEYVERTQEFDLLVVCPYCFHLEGTCTCDYTGPLVLVHAIRDKWEAK